MSCRSPDAGGDAAGAAAFAGLYRVRSARSAHPQRCARHLLRRCRLEGQSTAASASRPAAGTNSGRHAVIVVTGGGARVTQERKEMSEAEAAAFVTDLRKMMAEVTA
eukprot:scaffold1439_cov404-Prasinococcus_capsulatus_cf.AAC.4